LERTDYATWKIETLRKLAKAFGVRLRVSFEEFGTLLEDVSGFRNKMLPRPFEQDPVFNGAGVSRRKIRIRSKARPPGPQQPRRGGSLVVPRKAPGIEHGDLPTERTASGSFQQNVYVIGVRDGNNSSNLLMPRSLGSNEAYGYQGGAIDGAR